MRMIIEYKQDLDKCRTNDTAKDDDDKCLCAGVPVFFLVGSFWAPTGVNVIVTDLSVLVEHGIWPNLRRNSNNSIASPSSLASSSISISQNYEYPSFLERTIKSSLSQNNVGDITNDIEKYPVPIGTGWATGMVLDWLQPLSSQISITQHSIKYRYYH